MSQNRGNGSGFDEQIRAAWANALAATGSREAQLKLFFEAVSPKLWVAVNRFLSKRAYGSAAMNEVDDVTQETMIRFQQAIENGSLMPDEKIIPWLYTVAKNSLTDRMRRLARETEFVDDVPAGDEEKDFLADERFSEKLEEAFREMPYRTKAVFAMYVEAGLSQEDMAEVIDVPVTTIAYEMKRVKDCLKQLAHFDQADRPNATKTTRPKRLLM